MSCVADEPTGSEQLQVAIELPLRDLLVRELPFVALDLDEVVDVVAVACLAEGGA